MYQHAHQITLTNGCLACAHRYITCSTKALGMCASVSLYQARLSKHVCIRTCLKQLPHCSAVCFLWGLGRCSTDILSPCDCIMTYKHRHLLNDAHSEVLHETLPGICTTFSANAAQLSSGLMQGNSNATQGSFADAVSQLRFDQGLT